MPFFKSPEKLMGMFDAYLEQMNFCNNHLKDICQFFTDGCTSEGIEALALNLHEAESKADDLRRNIELMLHEGSFLPGFRGDLMAVVEALDQIPDSAEDVAFFIWLERVNIPPELREEFQALVYKVIETADALAKAVKKLFKKLEKVHVITHEIDLLESEADRIEQGLIKRIFEMPSLDLAQKMHLRDLVVIIGAIADRAEDAGDRLDVLTVKRKA